MAEPRADIHVESSEASTMRLSPLKQKILMNIQLGLICAIMTMACNRIFEPRAVQ